ncbi:MAG: DUF4384 domain-containing protein, partial [Gemmatimonadota bacterium]|nr:DUF4384 domain-containing protein [Gemmatimonadota bacterium]
MRWTMLTTMATLMVPSLAPVLAQAGWQSSSAQIALTITERDFFQRYDRVSVSFESALDGFVTVFRVDTDGRLRVLFPRDPWQDNFVAAGRRYRVPNRSSERGSHAFVVDDYPGVGYVFAVVSAAQFDYAAYVRNDHWEYRTVANAGRITGDPYVALVEVVERMLPSDDVPWAFDVAPYFVERQFEYPRFLCYDCHAYVTYPRWDPYRDWCGTFRIVIYNDIHRYPRGVYPVTRVVYPSVYIQPRYVFKTRTGSDPFVTRVARPGAHPTQARAPDAGVRGRDVGGVGSVPAPTRSVTRREDSNKGFGGLIRRFLGGNDDNESRRRPVVSQPDRDQHPPRPKLERRTPTRSTSTQPARRPSPTTRARPATAPT